MKRLTNDEALERAEALIAAAESIEIPERGQARGVAVRKRRRRLGRAQRLIDRYTKGYWARNVTAGQRRRAQTLECRIEAAWPEGLK